MTPFENFVRITIAAQHVGVSVSGLRKLIARRIVPVYRPTSRLLLLKLSQVDSAIEKFRTGGVK